MPPIVHLPKILTALFVCAALGTARSQTPVPDAFNPGANAYVYALAVQADGNILVGGNFATLGGQTRNSLGRLNADGSLDTAFNLGTDDRVYALAVQADGKILVGGLFTTLGGQTRNCLGRLNDDGTLEAAFDPGVGRWVSALAVQADGKILVGGWFTTLGGQTRNYLGRLNPDGTLDTAFNPGAGHGVSTLALQADGKVLVGGWFTTLGGQTRNYIGRVNADGSLDTAFNPGANGYYVSALAVQADGKILVGGWFTTLGGQTRNYLGRLNPDGTLDTAFNPGADGSVYALAVQADGKILMGGHFTTVGGQTRSRIARLSADGTLDTTFNPGANDYVISLAVQADGKILVGGSFTTLGGQPRNYLGRLNATDPATGSLSLDGTVLRWLRGGSTPEVWRTTFEHSADNGVTWSMLGAGTRMAGGWERSGVLVPSGTIRSRGYIAGGSVGGSAGIVETRLDFLLPPDQDQDTDGIPDEWEWATFGNTTASGLGTDFDGDGSSDRDERIASTNPKDKLDFLAIRSFHVQPAGDCMVKEVRWAGGGVGPVWLERADAPAGPFEPTGVTDPRTGRAYDVLPRVCETAFYRLAATNGAPESLRIVAFGAGGDALRTIVGWSSVSNRHYDLRRFPAASSNWTAVVTNVPGTPPMNVVTDCAPAAVSTWYRVRVREP